MFGDFVSILEFLNSFTDSLALKDTYPGGLTFAELETALTEKEVPDGAFFDILSFMLITVFDLQVRGAIKNINFLASGNIENNGYFFIDYVYIRQ